MNFLNWFRKPTQEKGCVFIDGDGGVPQLMDAFDKYAKGSEAYFVRQCSKDCEPRIMRDREDFNKIFLAGMKTRKEATDKFIAMMLQQKIRDGYSNFTVISSDTDFVDIFKMAIIANPEMNFKFRFIIPAGAVVQKDSNYKNWNDTDCQLDVVRA